MVMKPLPVILPASDLTTQLPAIPTSIEERDLVLDNLNLAIEMQDAKIVQKLIAEYAIDHDLMQRPYQSQQLVSLAKKAYLKIQGVDKSILEIAVEKNPKLARAIVSHLQFDIPALEKHTEELYIQAIQKKQADKLRNLRESNLDPNAGMGLLASTITDLACAQALVAPIGSVPPAKTLDLLIRNSQGGEEILLQKDGAHLKSLTEEVANYLFTAATRQKQASAAIMAAIHKDDAKALSGLLKKYQLHPDFTKYVTETPGQTGKVEATFLLSAISRELSCAELLLERGASPYAKGTMSSIENGLKITTELRPFTALAVSTPEVLDVFVKYHPGIVSNNHGLIFDLVYQAAAGDNLPLLQRALFYKADFHAAITPDKILWLVEQQKFTAIKMLIDAGANLVDTNPPLAEAIKKFGIDNQEVVPLVEKIFLQAVKAKNSAFAQSFIDHGWLEHPNEQQIAYAEKYLGKKHKVTAQLQQKAAKKTDHPPHEPSRNYQLPLPVALASFAALLFSVVKGWILPKREKANLNATQTLTVASASETQISTTEESSLSTLQKLEEKRNFVAKELEKEQQKYTAQQAELNTCCNEHIHCHQQLADMQNEFEQQLSDLQPDITAAKSIHDDIMGRFTEPRKEEKIAVHKKLYKDPLNLFDEKLAVQRASLETLQKQFDKLKSRPLLERVEAYGKLRTELATFKQTMNNFFKEYRGKVEVGITRQEIERAKAPKSAAKPKLKESKAVKKDVKKSTPPSSATLLPVTTANLSAPVVTSSSSSSASSTTRLVTDMLNRADSPAATDDLHGVLCISTAKLRDNKHFPKTQIATAPAALFTTAKAKSETKKAHLLKFKRVEEQAHEFNKLLPQSQPSAAESDIFALSYQGALFFFAKTLMHTDRFAEYSGVTHKRLKSLRDNLIYHREKYTHFTANDWQKIYQSFMELLFTRGLVEPLASQVLRAETSEKNEKNIAMLEFLIKDNGHKKEEQIDHSTESYADLTEQFATFNSEAASKSPDERLLWRCAEQFTLGLKGYKQYVKGAGIGYQGIIDAQADEAQAYGNEMRHRTTLTQLLAEASTAPVLKIE